jgi:hypothetical protein
MQSVERGRRQNSMYQRYQAPETWPWCSGVRRWFGLLSLEEQLFLKGRDIQLCRNSKGTIAPQSPASLRGYLDDSSLNDHGLFHAWRAVADHNGSDFPFWSGVRTRMCICQPDSKFLPAERSGEISKLVFSYPPGKLYLASNEMYKLYGEDSRMTPCIRHTPHSLHQRFRRRVYGFDRTALLNGGTFSRSGNRFRPLANAASRSACR